MELKIKQLNDEELKHDVPHWPEAWAEDRFQIMLTAEEELSVRRLHLDSFEIMGPKQHPEVRWKVVDLLGGVYWVTKTKKLMDAFEDAVKARYKSFVKEYTRKSTKKASHAPR